MSFDFFGEGIKGQPTIIFTKEENTFLQSKLPFLDSKKTQSIMIGSALQFLKFSGLRSENIQKILRNCKIEGKKTLTYDEMKKIFRGVALAQNGHEPSATNINANIKTKMPVFHDQDSEDEEQQPPKLQKEEQQIQKPPQQLPVSQKSNLNTAKDAQFAQFNNIPKPSSQAPPQKQPSIPENPIKAKILEFQAYWSKCNTKGNKIDGNQVKTICKNLSQRSNLSKAWKLCCLSHSGSLTKGQFYAFLQLVSLNKLPETMPSDLKAIVAEVDKNCFEKSNPKQSERTISITQNFSQLGSSQLFQNIGKPDANIFVAPPKQVPQANSMAIPTEIIAKKVSGKLQEGRKSLEQAQKGSEQQLLQLRRQQETMNNMMGQIDQFLLVVNNKNNEIRTQIDELKNNQNNLNTRLNKVCVGMNQVIIRQNSFIEELLRHIYQENELNQQRITVLENHVQQSNQNSAQMEKGFKQRNKESKAPQKVEKNAEVLQKQHHKQQVAVRDSQLKQKILAQEMSNDQNQHDHIPKTQINEPQKQQQSPAQSPKSNNEPSEQQKRYQQQVEYNNRMKMKQMQVIQLIHYLTPISPEEYPQIAQKITSYSEEQLNYAYAGLYQKLLEKQRAEQLAAERHQVKPQKKSNFPDEDEFNTSNFHEEQKAKKQRQDFFN